MVACWDMIGCRLAGSLLIHPATPYSSCHGGSLPLRVFSAASSVVTMATAAWPWVCCCSNDRLDLNSSLHLRRASRHTWLQQLTCFSLLAVKMWKRRFSAVTADRRLLCCLCAATLVHPPEALLDICKCCHGNVGREKSRKKVLITLALMNSRDIQILSDFSSISLKCFWDFIVAGKDISNCLVDILDSGSNVVETWDWMFTAGKKGQAVKLSLTLKNTTVPVKTHKQFTC